MCKIERISKNKALWIKKNIWKHIKFVGEEHFKWIFVIKKYLKTIF